MRQNERPDWQQRIARERIEILLGLAKKSFVKNPSRSKRYVELARKIGMRYRVRLDSGTKSSFCKKCNTLMFEKKTMDVSRDEKTRMVIIKCKNCNYIHKTGSR